MKAIRIAATVALVLGTASAAAATSVTVHDLGNGNINCVTAGGNVYISARMRGNYNQQCIMALRAAGSNANRMCHAWTMFSHGSNSTATPSSAARWARRRASS